MAFEVTGKITMIGEEKQVTDRFKKREFVLEIQEGFYAEFIKFQLTQDKCSLIDGFDKDEEVKVSFNLRGRPYNKNGETIYFTNLEAWKIDKQGGEAPQPSSDADSPGFEGLVPPPEQEQNNQGPSPADDDELPF